MKTNEQMTFKSNAALEQLAPLLGEWNIEITAMSMDPDPSATVRGHSSFAWLEGGAFLVQHSEMPNSAFPTTTSVMGPDEEASTYRMLYYDSRGVSRIYRMTFSGGIWTLWRDFPGFSQRFHGMFDESGRVITASWEKSTDGSSWEHDFDLTYTKVRYRPRRPRAVSWQSLSDGRTFALFGCPATATISGKNSPVRIREYKNRKRKNSREESKNHLFVGETSRYSV